MAICVRVRVASRTVVVVQLYDATTCGPLVLGRGAARCVDPAPCELPCRRAPCKMRVVPVPHRRRSGYRVRSCSRPRRAARRDDG